MKQFKTFVSMFVCVALILAITSPVLTAQKTQKSTKLININTATAQQLAKLPRVGEKTAERIVAFRKKNGKFKRIQDLMKVNGIGEKTFRKLAKLITV
jgi:competence protein ComEA